jgi:ABC-type lipoprotein export system ATPase subunit
VIIRIPDGDELGGSHSLVIIGPNGSGKTRFGATLAEQNSADHIGALRNIQLNPQISMRPAAQVTKELSDNLSRRRKRYWEMSSEIELLFSKLLAEDSMSATRFRDAHADGLSPSIEDTTIRELRRVWGTFFPGRKIDLGGYAAKVHATHYGAESEYNAQQMSDGERVALYLAARVLDAKGPLIVVDEPEIHFHSRLAVRFWNELESIRSDCRFVYITHDLTFALSRKTAQFLIVQPQKKPHLLPLDAELPPHTAMALLGAASFSVYAQRIVFCEGEESGSLDISIYSAWFKDQDTVVIPVGSCDNVIRCVQAFNEARLVTSVECIGTIDRDYWPDSYLDSLPDAVHALPFHEIESLLSTRGVFAAVATHQGVSKGVDDRYDAGLLESRQTFVGGKLCKQVSERFKRRCEIAALSVLSGLKQSDTLSDLEVLHVNAVAELHRKIQADTIFREERETIEDALSGTDQTFLKILPGKGALGALSKKLNLTIEGYVKLIKSGLEAKPDSDLYVFGQHLDHALKPFLPNRMS